jgi:hypothetical protein
MKSIANKILLAVCGMAVIVSIPYVATFNQQLKLVSQSYGTVVGGEFYLVGKWESQRAPKIRVRTDSGRELLFAHAFPYPAKNGDRVKVKVWKRALFGYKTTYEKVEPIQTK